MPYTVRNPEKISGKERIRPVERAGKTIPAKFYQDGYLADRIVGEELIMEIRPNAIVLLPCPGRHFLRKFCNKFGTQVLKSSTPTMESAL